MLAGYTRHALEHYREMQTSTPTLRAESPFDLVLDIYAEGNKQPVAVLIEKIIIHTTNNKNMQFKNI